MSRKHYLGVALTVGLLIIGACTFWWMRSHDRARAHGRVQAQEDGVTRTQAGVAASVGRGADEDSRRIVPSDSIHEDATADDMTSLASRKGPDSPQTQTQDLRSRFGLPPPGREREAWARKNLRASCRALVQVDGHFPADDIEVLVERIDRDGTAHPREKCESLRLSASSLLVLVPTERRVARSKSVRLLLVEDGKVSDSIELPLPPSSDYASMRASKHISTFLSYPYGWSVVGRLHAARVEKGQDPRESLRIAREQVEQIGRLLRLQFEAEKASVASPVQCRGAMRLLDKVVRDGIRRIDQDRGVR